METIILTIPQKSSGTGSIYDLASQHYDRHIEFDSEQYAIVYPDYLNRDIEYFEDRDSLFNYLNDDDNDTVYAVIINREGEILDHHGETLYGTGEII